MNPYAKCFADFDTAKAAADATFVAEMSAAADSETRRQAKVKWRQALQAALAALDACMAEVDDRNADGLDLCGGDNP